MSPLLYLPLDFCPPAGLTGVGFSPHKHSCLQGKSWPLQQTRGHRPQFRTGVTSWLQRWSNLCLELGARGPVSPQRATAAFSQPVNPASLSPDNPFQCQGPELSFYQDAVSLYLGLIF